MKLACVSVDLDSLPHYCRIHGLPESLLGERARSGVYRVAIPRLMELLSRRSAKATFFAIGEDLANAENASVLRDAHRSGVEIGNHSAHHDYALSRRPVNEIHDELRLGEEAISGVTGERPVGFRAPGYTLSPALYQALQDRGYQYDSSTFPAAPYYALKATVMGALRVLGRPSRAILDTPRVLLAPTGPYRPDPAQPYQRGDGKVLELPLTVAPVTRVPFYGTLAVALPEAAVRTVYRTVRGVELFNFHLHAIDVLDAEDGVPEALAKQQRDLAVPHRTKLQRLDSVLTWLSRDFELATLGEASGRWTHPGA